MEIVHFSSFVVLNVCRAQGMLRQQLTLLAGQSSLTLVPESILGCGCTAPWAQDWSAEETLA